MISYSSSPLKTIHRDNRIFNSFLNETDTNIDWETVNSFGEEWNKFDVFSEADIEKIGNDYFDIVSSDLLNKETTVLDVGFGSGRWIKYIAKHVKFVEGIDPSNAIFSAAHFLSSTPNVRLTQASVEAIPFTDNSFDFVYSLGVLHHLPNTELAIKRCFEKTKNGGHFLLYLYYNLDNRSIIHKSLFHVSNLLRKGISKLPRKLKSFVCDLIAILVYWPMAKLGNILSLFSSTMADSFPLGYYRKTSFHIMRNDALDRFGTPLELRFSKQEIESMLVRCGFYNITFSKNPPYWHVIAQKP